MSRERASVEREGRRASLESEGVRARGVKVVCGARSEVGRRKDWIAFGMDFVRWNVGERCVVRKEGVVKSLCMVLGGLLGERGGGGLTYLDVGVPFVEDGGIGAFLGLFRGCCFDTSC